MNQVSTSPEVSRQSSEVRLTRRGKIAAAVVGATAVAGIATLGGNVLPESIKDTLSAQGPERDIAHVNTEKVVNFVEQGGIGEFDLGSRNVIVSQASGEYSVDTDTLLQTATYTNAGRESFDDFNNVETATISEPYIISADVVSERNGGNIAMAMATIDGETQPVFTRVENLVNLEDGQPLEASALENPNFDAAVIRVD